jgi:hypothetical protein
VVGDDQHGAAGSLRRPGPGVGVLDGQAVGRVDAQGATGLEVGLRVRLAAQHRITRDHLGERALRERGEDRCHEPAVGHRDQRARDAVLLQARQQLDCSRAPRHRPLDRGDDVVEELFHDQGRLEVDPHVLANVEAGLDQVVADEVECVLTGPGPAVPLGQCVLRLDPVRLGVHQRAVHVPQDGGGSAH